MINIFNLFLFLLVVWLVFMVSHEKISIIYLIFGIFSSIFVSLICYNLKLIEKKSEMLYLSFAFYRHFFATYLKNFMPSILLLLKLAFGTSKFNHKAYKILLNSIAKRHSSELLQATINLTSGIFTIKNGESYIEVYAIDERFYQNFNLKKTFKTLENINDDNIV